MKKRFLLRFVSLIILITAFQDSIGQTLKIVPPVPNAMKMTEYNTQRPNMYTGTASVTIPLYAIDFDGWQLPLSISYNATGIRTGEEASEVGLGWALNATGVISRTVRGGDDFFKGTLNGNGVGRGYAYNRVPIPEPFDLGYDQFTMTNPPPTSYYAYLAGSRPDTEPDVFNYNFFGYSGQFILTQKIESPAIIAVGDPNVGRPISAIKLTQDATSIIFNESLSLPPTFSILTPEGFRGDFTAKERSTSLTGNREATTNELACGEDKIDVVALQNESGQLRTITSWYLTKITSPRGKEIIFKYDLDANGNSLYLSNARAFGEDQELAANPLCINNIQEHVYLKEIKFTDSLTSVKVTFQMEDREDIRKNTYFDQNSNSVKLFPNSKNLKRYKSIHITGLLDAQSTLNKNIEFSQTYFNQQYHNTSGYNEDEVIWMRSRLDRLTIDDQEYLFSYLTGQKGLPSKLTKAVDYFGFYNGQDLNNHLLWPAIVGGVNDNLCNLADNSSFFYYRPNSLRLPDFDFGQAGMLKKIIYPTRGYTLFEYEAHTYMPEAIGIAREEAGLKKAGGARIASITDYNYDNSIARQKLYRYTRTGVIDLQNSTGKLMTPLLNLGKAPRYVYGDPIQGAIDPNVCNFFIQSNSSIPGNNAAEGKLIGYSVVHEIVTGDGKSYKNSYCFENKPNKVLTTLLAVDGFANTNGQVKEIRNYNSDGKIVQWIKNSGYEDYSLPSVTGIAYRATTDYSRLNYWQNYNIKRTFATPTLIETVIAETPSGIVENETGTILGTGNSITTSQRNTFNTNFLLKSQEMTDSKGTILKTEYRRPSDYSNPSSVLQRMLDRSVNIVEPVIEEITSRNGTVLTAKATLYGLNNNTTIYTKSSLYYEQKQGESFTYSDNGSAFPTFYKEKVKFTSYDSKWNVQEYIGSDGITHSFIWGNNRKFPIVHGAGLPYSELLLAFNTATQSAAPGSDTYEVAIRNHPNTLGRQITTYTHNPFVGISRMTDPSGIKKTFQYDSYGRLQKVLDNSDKTIEQYQYHFRERPQTRILSLSGNLNFGTLTPDMYYSQFLTYVRCGEELKTRKLTISNTGEDELNVERIELPLGFRSSWNGGVIPPHESIDVAVSFNNTVSLGTYSGTISVISDKTAGTSEIAISAVYANRTCSISTPSILDFGTVTGSVFNKPLQVTNTGNAPIELTNALMNWNGVVSSSYAPCTSCQFSVSTNFNNVDIQTIRHAGICIAPGESFIVPVNFIAQPGNNGLKTEKLSLLTDLDPAVCQANYKDAVTVQANVQQPISTISITNTPIAFGDFTESSRSTTITISNTGTLGFSVTGLSVLDPSVASYFSISPSSFTLNPAGQPGDSKEVTLTFTPSGFDQYVNTTITFVNDAMTGNETVAVTGKRYSWRKMVLRSGGQLFSELFFDYTGESKLITITNEGNSPLDVTGISPGNQSLQGFSVTNFTPVLLASGQSTSFSVVMTTSPYPADQIITVNSTKNDGTDHFIINRRTRVINFSETAITMPGFTGASSTSNLTISNTGNSPLTISSVTSSNSRFAVPFSGPLTILPGAQQLFTVTYTPTDFSSQSTTITINSDANGGANYFNVSAQRTQLYQMSVNGSVVLRPSASLQTITVSNDGNVDVTISISNKNTTNFTATYWRPSGGQWTQFTTLPYTLPAGSQMQIRVVSAQVNDYSTASGTITITNDHGTQYDVNTSRNPTS